ncbi:MAG: hypothetical protein ACKO96_29695, partial [Flammeovirgaceae bacterium]
LELIHLIKNFLLYMVISPTDIEIHIHDWVSDLAKFKFFGYQLYYSVLGFLILRYLPQTLITTLGYLGLIDSLFF